MEYRGVFSLLLKKFTLNATFKGRKPNFNNSMKPDSARALFDFAVDHARKLIGEDKVQAGAFGEKMEVELTNDGPVTIVLDQKGKNDQEEEQE